MSYVIRLVARPGDLPPGVAATLDDLDRATLGAAWPKARGWWWLAVHRPSGRPVGFAGMSTVIPDGPKRGVFFCRAGILPPHRGKGLQGRLIRARERLARRLGYAWAYTYTDQDNLASANNFLKAGWRLGPVWPGHNGARMTYLRKRLVA